MRTSPESVEFKMDIGWTRGVLYSVLSVYTFKSTHILVNIQSKFSQDLVNFSFKKKCLKILQLYDLKKINL